MTPKEFEAFRSMFPEIPKNVTELSVDVSIVGEPTIIRCAFIPSEVVTTCDSCNEAKIPTRLKDVDPVIREGMLSPSCNKFS